MDLADMKLDGTQIVEEDYYTFLKQYV